MREKELEREREKPREKSPNLSQNRNPSQSKLPQFYVVIHFASQLAAFLLLASFQHWASKLVIWCIQLANSNLLCSGANPLHVSEFNEINQVVSVFFTFSWLDHLTSVLLFVRMDETINFLPWIRVLVMKIIKSSAFFIRLNGMKAGGLPLEGVLLNALWIFEKVVILFLLNWQPIYFPYMIASKVLTKPPGCWVMSVVVCYWWLCHYVAAARFVWDRDYGEDIKSSPFQGICYELQHLQFPEIKVLCFSCEVVHYSGFLLSMKRLRIVAHKICLVSKGEEKSLLNSCIKLYFFQSHQKGSCKVSSKVWLPLLEKFSLESSSLELGEMFIFFLISMKYYVFCLFVRISNFYDLIINWQAKKEFQFLQKIIIIVFFLILVFLVCSFSRCCLKSYLIAMIGLSLNYTHLVLVSSDFGLIAPFLSNLAKSKLENRSYWIGFCWLFLKNVFLYKNSDSGYRSYWIGIYHSILGPRSYWNGEKYFYHHMPIEGLVYFVPKSSVKEKCNVFLQVIIHYLINIYSLSAIHYVMPSCKILWMFLNVRELANLNFLSCKVWLEKIIVIRYDEGQDLVKSCVPNDYVL
ncbi:uncharacterized protein LOC125494979 [Beta vulgaris subsp. vulgaris]|uniref:uncharacterized protein LOC125494979 n=1 Tax=Beta vulgaris subsp. vulgaris TaxID=3555 RepID=UPI002036FC97|nr:uncharacterized protein LOC125494979 [Beta vulgaris subsp. vulgaris]